MARNRQTKKIKDKIRLMKAFNGWDEVIAIYFIKSTNSITLIHKKYGIMYLVSELDFYVNSRYSKNAIKKAYLELYNNIKKTSLKYINNNTKIFNVNDFDYDLAEYTKADRIEYEVDINGRIGTRFTDGLSNS
jgi:hypothetical protein